MIQQHFSIRIDGHEATLEAYLPDERHKSKEGTPKKRRAILILPGGGYAYTSFREAEPIALAFLAQGFSCFVLYYTCAPEARFPTALRQAALGMAHIRKNADALNIDEHHVYVMGFSAGGHLAASLSTLYARGEVTDIVPADLARPDGMVLCYAVLLSQFKAHQGSIENLLGDEKGNQALLSLVSLPGQVTPDTPPAFIWHTYTDGSVPVENSLEMARALRACGVPFELHIFPQGGHGLSLATNEVGSPQETCAQWVALCGQWLKHQA